MCVCACSHVCVCTYVCATPTCRDQLRAELNGLRQESESKHAQWQEERLHLTKDKTKLEEQLKLQLDQADNYKQEIARVCGCGQWV